MKTRWTLSFLIVAACVIVLRTDAATPPAGDWQAFVLLNKGDSQLSLVQLRIAGATTTGPITGSICVAQNHVCTGTSTNIRGFWNNETQTLLFYRQALQPGPPSPTDLDSIQIYTGHVYPCTAGSPRQCLGGCFEAFANSGGSPQKSVLGWHATLD